MEELSVTSVRNRPSLPPALSRTFGMDDPMRQMLRWGSLSGYSWKKNWKISCYWSCRFTKRQKQPTPMISFQYFPKAIRRFLASVVWRFLVDRNSVLLLLERCWRTRQYWFWTKQQGTVKFVFKTMRILTEHYVELLNGIIFCSFSVHWIPSLKNLFKNFKSQKAFRSVVTII